MCYGTICFVDALINNMHMYEWTPGSITIKDCCPAVGALIKIGDPALQHMIAILATEQSEDKKRFLARWVIENVLGGGKNTSWNDRKGKVLAKALLEEEIEIEPKEDRRQNLQKSLKELDQALQEQK